MAVEFIEDTVNQRCVVKSDKMVKDIIIQKDRSGFIFFEVKFEAGQVPQELSGKYSSMLRAKEAVASYLNNMKETLAARRENFAKEREERKARQNAPVSDAEDGQHVHKGPNH